MATVKSQHINSQGERISLQNRILEGREVECLVIHDDPPPRGTSQQAPMLLDEGTRAWLLEQLSPADISAAVAGRERIGELEAALRSTLAGFEWAYDFGRCRHDDSSRRIIASARTALSLPPTTTNAEKE